MRFALDNVSLSIYELGGDDWFDILNASRLIVVRATRHYLVSCSKFVTLIDAGCCLAIFHVRHVVQLSREVETQVMLMI